MNTDFVIINTNARSLCPKINSFIDCFEEMEASLAVVTETWLTDGQALQDDIQDLELGSKIKLLARNRTPSVNGVCHGGVAIAFRNDRCSLAEVHMGNPDNYEVMVAAGSVPGHSRKLVVIAAYVPPNYTRARGLGCLGYIAEVVLAMKRKYRQPYVVVAGDFNQWQVDQSLADFSYVDEVRVGPTRGSRAIDRIFVSIGQWDGTVVESGSLPPLLSLIHI